MRGAGGLNLIQGNYGGEEVSIFFHCYHCIKMYTEHTVYGYHEAMLVRTELGDFPIKYCYCKPMLKHYSFFTKSLQMVNAAMKLKDTCSLEEKL